MTYGLNREDSMVSWCVIILLKTLDSLNDYSSTR